MRTTLKRTGAAGRNALVLPRARIRCLLAATDFSDVARLGTDYAMRIAHRLGASVHVMHVVEPLPVVEGMEAYPLLPAPSELVRHAGARLKKITRATGLHRLRVSSSVRVGKPFQAIISTAAEQSSDLIVMATHGYTGINHALLGSTAERVVRHAPCSVLTVPARNARLNGHGRSPDLTIAKILVPLDFSAISKDAIPWAVFLAESFNAEIHLFNVTEIFPVDHLMGREIMNHAITPLLQDAREALDRIARNLRLETGARVSASVIDGVPYKEICHAAQESGADLIVITTHGYTGFRHLWLGSTAERVVRHARCPVLVVRQPDKMHTQ